MSDIMRPVPFKELVHRIISEYTVSQSIFGIAGSNFYKEKTNSSFSIFGESCSIPLGPAAGPHTQLAQNIAASYLCGSRFFELKTVQILDTLEIKKPCIDAADECFNTEWSSEFTIPKAFDEYLKGWFLLHLLEKLFDLDSKDSSFIFNMSVGYDLEGIQSPKVDTFIEQMKDARKSELFAQYKKELSEILNDSRLFSGSTLEEKLPELQGLPERISPAICSQLTLSTMHGCPPDEIEKICSYMLTEKKLNTFVKLNPTLLGYDFVSKLIQDAGYEYIALSEESFSHDLSYNTAIPMLKRLKKLASDSQLGFGVKLTNTLGTINRLERLPENEMYMSGRLLFPLSINTAAKIASEFDGDIEISFCGGVALNNIEGILKTGIMPLTLATDLLKPGGYLRLSQLASIAEAATQGKKIDVAALQKLAQLSISSDYHYKDKRWRGYTSVSVEAELPAYNCYVAPCTVACPIGQDVPEYITLTKQGRYKEALELIYSKNPLPAITGEICAHQCQYNCTRRDYEGAVEIREIKKIALNNGFEEYLESYMFPEGAGKGKAAVIGAGPAGLSAAYFLAKENFKVTVFDRHLKAGGVVEFNIPEFRIPRETIEHDIEFIKKHGVEFVFNYNFDYDIEKLKKDGYDFILIAVGAEKVRSFSLEGTNTNIMSSHTFIARFNSERDTLDLGKDVVVVGAGDTAMDSARAALRVKGVEKVTVAYRRAERQMPATEEEYEDCLADGIHFKWLRNPEKFDEDGTLHLRVMELGEKDASGRRSPVPTDKVETIRCDTLIPSIGETVNYEEIASGSIKTNSEGRFDIDQSLQLDIDNVYLIGDAHTGPSTIVGCISEARKAVDAIVTKATGKSTAVEVDSPFDDEQLAAITMAKGTVLKPHDRKSPYLDKDFAAREGERCLQCNSICNKCVDVCPNRANIAVAVGSMTNRFQIVHLDSYCNECGNCATFCPWEGRPYTDKFTVFSKEEDFANSKNEGVYLSNGTIKIRHKGVETDGSVDDYGNLDSPLELDENFRKVFAELYTKHSYLFGEAAQ